MQKPANRMVGRPTADFLLNDVPVTMLLTRMQHSREHGRYEADQLLFLLDEVLDRFKPDVLLSYGGHVTVQEMLQRARRRGIATVMALHNFGCEHRQYFAHVDHVFCCSEFLRDTYQAAIGLDSTALPPPIDWAEAEAPGELRRFVTFVNPAPHKGAAVFARLAERLGRKRPDIPMLVVQSAAGAGALNAVPGLDFSKSTQIMAAPAAPRPADFLALTRLLIVPSTGREPVGRVAIEAMINGIPPIVSDRGALPHILRGAGRVVPLPAAIPEQPRELPSAEEVQPWLDAICELWDDAAVYDAAADRARETARQHYSESLTRGHYRDYFANLQTAPISDGASQ